MGVKEVFIYLESLGLINVAIPFVIVFVVLYAVLNWVKLFKDNRVNAVLAALIAFIAIAAADVVRNLDLFSYYLVLLIFVVTAVFMFIALLGGKLELTSDKYKPYFAWSVVVILCLLIFYSLYESGVRVDLGIDYYLLRSLAPIAIAVLVFVLIVWFISSPGKKERKAPGAAKSGEAPAKKEYSAPRISPKIKVPEEVAEKIRENPEMLNQFVKALQRLRSQ